MRALCVLLLGAAACSSAEPALGDASATGTSYGIVSAFSYNSGTTSFDLGLSQLQPGTTCERMHELASLDWIVATLKVHVQNVGAIEPVTIPVMTSDAAAGVAEPAAVVQLFDDPQNLGSLNESASFPQGSLVIDAVDGDTVEGTLHVIGSSDSNASIDTTVTFSAPKC